MSSPSSPPSSPGAAAAAQQPLVNRYTDKTATQERPCFICLRPTTKVLASQQGGDWFYACPSHLQDTGFAKGEGIPTVPTVEALAAVAAARKKKAGLDAAKKKADEAKDSSNSPQQQQKSHAAKLGSAVLSGLGHVATKTAASVTSFYTDEDAIERKKLQDEVDRLEREARMKPAFWVLHRDIFYLRQAEVKKRTAKKALNGISFPRVPNGL
ncbi:hypothetical protein DFQ27_007072 [Actinomortierella ambigua]|uniref:VPS4-associated protein 1 n=1 Tax=Actinomortierella ambigua TaxID=1343610 RepID=A0A9P6PXB1_9FUNG|nr:hypothetical protein DFQ27_007072 [Actinomortierella ambigua]